MAIKNVKLDTSSTTTQYAYAYETTYFSNMLSSGDVLLKPFTFVIGAAANVQLTYTSPVNSGSLVSGKQVLETLQIQGAYEDYLIQRAGAKVTLTNELTGQTIAFNLMAPGKGGVLGYNLQFLDGSIAVVASRNNAGTLVYSIREGGNDTSFWSTVAKNGIGVGKYDLGKIDPDKVNRDVNTADIVHWDNVFTLNEAITLGLDQLPSPYVLSDAVVDLGVLNVEGVISQKAVAQQILDHAENASSQALHLTYTLNDTLSHFTADSAASVLAAAVSYTLEDAPGYLGVVTEAQAALIEAARDQADYTYTVGGTAPPICDVTSNPILFNEAYYLAQNPDVAAAVMAGLFGSGIEHWNQYGKSEGRVSSALFDLQTYREQNPDLIEAGLTTPAQLRAHFSTYGFLEGRTSMKADLFDYQYYAQSNPDLALAGITSQGDLQKHFYAYGINEGRVASPKINGVSYIEKYADLNALITSGGGIHGLTDKDAAGIYHYYHCGIVEGLELGNPRSGLVTTLKDAVAPTLSLSSPVDDATDVGIAKTVVLTFSESVKAGVGNIQIIRSSDNSPFLSIAVTDSQVSFDGSVVKINPSSFFAYDTSYYVKVAAGAVTDVAGNAYAGIDSSSTLNFKTVSYTPPVAPPPSDMTPPVMNSAAVSSDGLSVVITYSEALTGPAEATDYAVLVGGNYMGSVSAAVIGVGANANQVTLTMSSAIPQGATVSDLYYFPSASVIDSIKDLASNAALYQDLVTITNNSTVTAPIVGTAGPDNLNGTAGAELIDGLANHDTITGGAGADTITGGSGDDVFVYTANADWSASEVITDFANGALNAASLTNGSLTNINGDIFLFDLSDLASISGYVALGTTVTNGVSTLVNGDWVIGNAANAAHAQFLLSGTDTLQFDPDGTGAATPITVVGHYTYTWLTGTMIALQA